tara:strand:+ start:83 stop:322 length:240 start_codon:yes stop_codon:yes gene_type:complete
MKLFQKFMLFISIVFLTTCGSTRNWFRVDYDDILYLEFKHFGTDSVYIFTPDELYKIDEALFNNPNFDLTAIVFKNNVE